MRALKRRRAFTLVELIIGMVMMVIVMGGIITGLSMGLRLYTRAEANLHGGNFWCGLWSCASTRARRPTAR
ncbi:MAG: type II secretion system GspH family protein [Synergistaceae bacterium]|nr:type II secretion system GspH family protein [Synergistaceae bacterium]